MGRFYDTSTIVDRSKLWYSEPNIRVYLPMYNNGGFIHYSHVSYGFDGAKKHFAIVVGKQLKQFKQSQGLPIRQRVFSVSMLAYLIDNFGTVHRRGALTY